MILWWRARREKMIKHTKSQHKWRNLSTLLFSLLLLFSFWASQLVVLFKCFWKFIESSFNYNHSLIIYFYIYVYFRFQFKSDSEDNSFAKLNPWKLASHQQLAACLCLENSIQEAYDKRNCQGRFSEWSDIHLYLLGAISIYTLRSF